MRLYRLLFASLLLLAFFAVPVSAQAAKEEATPPGSFDPVVEQKFAEIVTPKEMKGFLDSHFTLGQNIVEVIRFMRLYDFQCAYKKDVPFQGHAKVPFLHCEKVIDPRQITVEKWNIAFLYDDAKLISILANRDLVPL